VQRNVLATNQRERDSLKEDLKKRVFLQKKTSFKRGVSSAARGGKGPRHFREKLSPREKNLLRRRRGKSYEGKISLPKRKEQFPGQDADKRKRSEVI